MTEPRKEGLHRSRSACKRLYWRRNRCACTHVILVSDRFLVVGEAHPQIGGGRHDKMVVRAAGGKDRDLLEMARNDKKGRALRKRSSGHWIGCGSQRPRVRAAQLGRWDGGRRPGTLGGSARKQRWVSHDVMRRPRLCLKFSSPPGTPGRAGRSGIRYARSSASLTFGCCREMVHHTTPFPPPSSVPYCAHNPSYTVL